MGVNVLSPKKTKRLSELARKELDRALVRSHGKHWIAECRTADDRHYLVNRNTGATAEIVSPIHWTSCRELNTKEGDART